jgi:hypothetical protein
MAGGICPVDSEKTPERWGFKGGERAGSVGEVGASASHPPRSAVAPRLGI